MSANIEEFKYYRMSWEEREKLLNKLERKLRSIGDILFAYVYGSFIKREFFRDIDVAIWIKELEEAFKYEVEASSKIEISLNIPVDIHVLNEAPLPFKYTVFTEGRLLFSNNEKARIRVIDETIRQYEDLRILRSLYEEK